MQGYILLLTQFSVRENVQPPNTEKGEKFDNFDCWRGVLDHYNPLVTPRLVRTLEDKYSAFFGFKFDCYCLYDLFP